MHVSIIALRDNKTIHTGVLCKEIEVDTPFFSIHLFSENKFVVIENAQKMVVVLNEIFLVNFLEYVIVNNELPLSLVNYAKNSENKFFYVCFNAVSKFIVSTLKNIWFFKIQEDSKNRSYLKSFLCAFCMICIVFGGRKIALEEVQPCEKVEIQSHIYQGYKTILLHTVDESLIAEKPSRAVAQVSHRENFEKNEPMNSIKKSPKFRKKNASFIRKENDNEAAYFLFKK